MGNEEMYMRSELYRELADPIIIKKCSHLLDAGISVDFVASQKQKKVGKEKIVLAECKKVQEFYKLYCPFDFIIVIYELNCEGLSNEQMKILIWHELEHIGIDPETGEFYVKPHDVEEFDDIINAHGLHWQEVDNG